MVPFRTTMPTCFPEHESIAQDMTSFGRAELYCMKVNFTRVVSVQAQPFHVSDYSTTSVLAEKQHPS